MLTLISLAVILGIGLWSYRRQLWIWAVALLTGLFWLIALGPQVRINGYETEIPGLFPLLLRIPFFHTNMRLTYSTHDCVSVK